MSEGLRRSPRQQCITTKAELKLNPIPILPLPLFLSLPLPLPLLVSLPLLLPLSLT